MEFRKLSDGFGLEVFGVDVSRPLPAADFQEIWNAFFKGQVLVILWPDLVLFLPRLFPPGTL